MKYAVMYFVMTSGRRSYYAVDDGVIQRRAAQVNDREHRRAE
jgi:hypothetical protein